jgi:hypothetical protein
MATQWQIKKWPIGRLINYHLLNALQSPYKGFFYGLSTPLTAGCYLAAISLQPLYIYFSNFL